MAPENIIASDVADVCRNRVQDMGAQVTTDNTEVVAKSVSADCRLRLFDSGRLVQGVWFRAVALAAIATLPPPAPGDRD